MLAARGDYAGAGLAGESKKVIERPAICLQRIVRQPQIRLNPKPCACVFARLHRLVAVDLKGNEARFRHAAFDVE